MKKNFKPFSLAFVLMMLTGCTINIPNPSSSSSSGSGSSSSSGNGNTNNDFATQPSDAYLKNSEEYNTFWAPTSDIKIKLDFLPGALEAIEQYGKGIYEDYYFPVNVTINVNGTDYYFPEAGARRKGNMSKGDSFENGRIHYKLSFGETFDEDFYKNNTPAFYKTWKEGDKDYEERKDRTFLDMEKLDLKWNRNNDQTNLRQSYTNYLYRKNGIIAGNNTIGNVQVFKSGESTGVNLTYDILESIDKIFIRRFFNKASSKGDLYKTTYTGAGPANFTSDAISLSGGEYVVNPSKVGVEDSENNYHPSYDLKTNKKTSNHADLINLIKTFNYDKSPAATFIDTAKQLIDFDYMAKFLAISYAVGDPDDIRCNYNNAYVYFEPTTHKAFFIPYDHDRVMGITTGYGGGLMPSRGFVSTKAGGYQGDNLQENPIFWRLLINDNTQGLGRYLETIPESFNKCKEQILAIKNGQDFTPAAFDNYVNQFVYKGEGSTSSNTANPYSYTDYYNNLIYQITNDPRLK